MDIKRRIEKNKILNKIKDINTSINRNNEKNKFVKTSQYGIDFVKIQTTEIKEKLVKLEVELTNCNDRLQDLNDGKLDDELNEEYKKHQDENIIHQLSISNTKIKKNTESLINKKISNDYMSNIISDSKKSRQTEKDINYAYKYFYRVIDELPEYMKNNLKKMANNKGYIWRGIVFYGELPCDNDNNVLFEKVKGNLLIIHEYSPTCYTKYEKYGKNKKQFISQVARNKKNINFTLLDYKK